MTTGFDFLNMAEVVLKLGSVSRITRDRAGRQESDTTHTAMLAVACVSMLRSCRDVRCACSKLDAVAVHELCLVHDLSEFKHGDIPTLRITTEEKARKDRQEADALRDLHATFDGTWIARRLVEYLAQVTPESRYVRAMDKNMPKLTHLLNDLAVLREMRMTAEEFRQRIVIDQSAEMAKYAAEFRCVMEMHAGLAERIAQGLPGEYGPRGCNRHRDCDSAIAEFRSANGKDPGFNFCCHDESCEDCFGS